MTVKKYFERLGKYQNVTFIKARARKDANTPFYHDEYQTTPIGTVSEWLSSNLMDYIVLNDKQMPIDWLCGAPWGNQVKKGWLKCLLIISREDAELLYSKEQFVEMEEYIDEQITGA